MSEPTEPITLQSFWRGRGGGREYRLLVVGHQDDGRLLCRRIGVPQSAIHVLGDELLVTEEQLRSGYEPEPTRNWWTEVILNGKEAPRRGDVLNGSKVLESFPLEAVKRNGRVMVRLEGHDPADFIAL